MARRKKRRRKNPAINWTLLGLGLLGGTAAAASSYALEGTELKQIYVGLIQTGASLAIGIPLSMVNQGLGTGVAVGGGSIGIKTLGAEAAQMLSKPAGGGNGNTSAIRARTGATRASIGGRKRRAQLPAAQSVNVSRLFDAIKARVR